MAIYTASGFYWRIHAFLRFPFRPGPEKARLRFTAAIQTFDETEGRKTNEFSLFLNDVSEGFYGNIYKTSEWKKLNSKELGLSNSRIPKSAKVVLNILKRQGFDVYLVGGCVRDLILQSVPKDFDIITSAELKEVMKIFSRCEIVGKRFPICHVHIEDEIVEVSSFSTSAKDRRRDFSLGFDKPIDCHEKDFMRWRNCLQRDFTINGLMFDPYAKLVYDYMGGVEDIRKAKVQTITPAGFSLTEDSARILRAVRIAGRLGFQFTKETALAIKNLSTTILQLDRGRILMELNYMLAYGSAETSLRLLWRFGLLEVLLPIQASYFVRTGFRRRDKKSNLLLALFSKLDRYLAPDRPCHSSLWIALLAFHNALFDNPFDPVVVATFALAVHSGGDFLEASSIAKRITTQYDISFPELLEPQNLHTEALKKQVMHLAASIQSTLARMTDEYAVSRAMSEYPKAPHSDLVFIPLTLYLRVCKIFECVRSGKEMGFIPKEGSMIDHEFLALGSLQEVRHVFARVVFDTVYPLDAKR